MYSLRRMKFIAPLGETQNGAPYSLSTDEERVRWKTFSDGEIISFAEESGSFGMTHSEFRQQ